MEASVVCKCITLPHCSARAAMDWRLKLMAKISRRAIMSVVDTSTDDFNTRYRKQMEEDKLNSQRPVEQKDEQAGQSEHQEKEQNEIQSDKEILDVSDVEQDQESEKQDYIESEDEAETCEINEVDDIGSGAESGNSSDEEVKADVVPKMPKFDGYPIENMDLFFKYCTTILLWFI